MSTTDPSAPAQSLEPAFARTKVPGVFRRANGRFVVFWRGADGKQRSRTFVDELDARSFKADVDRDKSRGQLHDPSALTVEEYLDAWLERYSGRTKRGISKHTLDEYRSDLIPIKKLIGRRKLSALTRAHVRGVVAALLDGEGRTPRRPRTVRTVQKMVAPLKAALADAVEDDVLPRNPAEGVSVRARTAGGEEPKPERRALSDEEVRAIVAHTDEEHRLLVRFVAETGVRIGEAIAVRWGDLDFGDDGGSVRVTRAIRKGTVKTTKSAHGLRQVPFSGSLARDLALARAVSLHPGDADYAFATATGTAPDPSTLTMRVLKPAAAAAGVDMHGAWHVLRRSAITRWIHDGMSPKMAQELAGHHTPNFTLSVYAEVRERDVERAREYVRAF